MNSRTAASLINADLWALYSETEQNKRRGFFSPVADNVGISNERACQIFHDSVASYKYSYNLTESDRKTITQVVSKMRNTKTLQIAREWAIEKLLRGK